MIDLSHGPFKCVGDWAGNDATATDNYPAIAAAIASIPVSPVAGLNDYGGCQGDTLVFPAGSFMISQPLVLPPGVSLQGSGQYATTLVCPKAFSPTNHFIDLGNATLKTAAFGGTIKDMCLWSHNDAPISGSAMVYTNNAQDSGAIIDRVRIYGFNRRCFWGEIGYGGATYVGLHQVSGNTSVAGIPAFMFNYGESTMVHLDVLEPVGWRASLDPTNPAYNQPVAGTIGVALLGGFFHIEHFHPEQLDQALFINMPTVECFADINHMTGGPVTNQLVVIQNNAKQLGRIRLANVVRNGVSGYTVFNGQPGGSSSYAEITDPIRF
jgi:hypothetical protein